VAASATAAAPAAASRLPNDVHVQVNSPSAVSHVTAPSIAASEHETTTSVTSSQQETATVTGSGTTTEIRLVRPPASWASEWWKHFDLFDRRYHKEKANAKIACCRYCKAEIKFKNGNSGLSNHMQFKHRDKFVKQETETRKRKRSVAEQLGAQPKAKMQARMLASTVAWVIEEKQPLNVVEKQAYRRMMEQASGGKFPDFDAKAIRKEVMLLGDICKTAVKEELKGKYFAVTTDHWTSNNNESYENHAILCKHYEAITGVPLTEAILPGIYDMDIDEELDVG
jgi:hypothetical protein